MPIIYAKCGYNQRTKKELLQGPSHLGGGGFVPLYATANSGLVLHFIRQWRSPSEHIGKVARVVYAWSQANSGVSFSLFDKPSIEIPHLQGKVIPKIRKFLSEINARITLDTSYIRPKL